ncbi:MAG: HNH endonuclease [Syntrophaceae bacterium]|nr:HNH endonuclease [Nanoarchaeota archaeon]MCG2740356.1 HNH endonuclease [Syntrophaceae bacterium]
MTRTSKQHKETKQLLKGISNKRARIVIEHILGHGFITTEELEKKYGYNHPPRAARDVREAGIPLETFRVKDAEGRTIAAYRFGDLTQVRKGRLQGRQTFPKQFKDPLYEKQNGRCGICAGKFEPRYMQIDHRVPYEVAGETQGELNPEHFMLACGSCNRAKSWSCEHCENGLNEKFPNVCSKCYWANPENYVHIALREIRRADIVWEEDEVLVYEKLKQQAKQNSSPLPEFVKKVVKKFVEE